MRVNRNERGFALVGAVFALVVIATLVAGAFFASMQEVTIGRNSQTYQKAFGAAEGGMSKQIASWPTRTSRLNNMAVGDSATYVDTLPDGKTTATTYIRRLNTMLFLMRSVGGSGTSQRVLGSIAKLQFAQLNIKAALTLRNSLQIGGSSFINGADQNPSGWGCPAVNDTLAGIRTQDSSGITYSGCNNGSCIAGSPKIQQDTTLKDSTFQKFGGITYWDLAAMATIVYNGSTGPLNGLAPIGTPTTCTTSNTNNWGDPYRPGTVVGCQSYYPIIHVAGTRVNDTVVNGSGNLQLTGGYGQGILLVDGDLTVSGGFEFYGPVIVLGHFKTTGTGGHFNGGVMSSDVDLEQNTVLGNAIVNYSQCAIITALKGSSSARLLKERRWMDLTQ